MTITLEKEEFLTLRRLLLEELHSELQFENDKELMSGIAWREEHERIVSFKLTLLKKLGNIHSRGEIKACNLQV